MIVEVRVVQTGMKLTYDSSHSKNFTVINGASTFWHCAWQKQRSMDG